MRCKCKNCNNTIFSDEIDWRNPQCPYCNQPPSPEWSGRVINGFQIIGEPGRGNNGIVFWACEVWRERPVALKILEGERAADKSYVERFMAEAKAAARLSHPNIIKAIDAGLSNDGVYYFAMELVDGPTIEEKIESGGALPLSETLRIATRIAFALEYAWSSQQLTHGDIKPGNIIMDPNGEPKLADLGLAKFGNETNQECEELSATPMYAPPEVILWQFDKIGMLSDIYSFGATLYEMFSGTAPFAGRSVEDVLQAQLKENPPELKTILTGFDPEISDFVAAMMSKKCEDRPESHLQVATFMSSKLIYDKELPPGSEELEITVDTGTPSKGSKKFFSNKISKSIIYLAAGALLGIIFLYFWFR